MNTYNDLEKGRKVLILNQLIDFLYFIMQDNRTQ